MEVHGLGLHGLGKGDKGVWLLECHRQETKTKTPKARDERRAAEPKKLQSEHIYLQNKHAILHLSRYKVGGEGWWARLPNSVEKSATPYPQDAMANPPSPGLYSTAGMAIPVLNNMITSLDGVIVLGHDGDLASPNHPIPPTLELTQNIGVFKIQNVENQSCPKYISMSMQHRCVEDLRGLKTDKTYNI